MNNDVAFIFQLLLILAIAWSVVSALVEYIDRKQDRRHPMATRTHKPLMAVKRQPWGKITR